MLNSDLWVSAISISDYRYVSVVPSEYVQCSYIQSDGGEYFDTGVTEDGSGKLFKLKYMQLPVSTTKMVINTWNGGQGTQRFASGNGTIFAMWNYSNGTGSISLTNSVEHKIEYSDLATNGYLIIDGNKQSYTYSGSPEACGYSYKLFGGYGYNTSGIESGNTMRLYLAQIFDNELNLIRNYIPCYRISDKVAGMYDTVNGTFTSNGYGSGAFTYSL